MFRGSDARVLHTLFWSCLSQILVGVITKWITAANHYGFARGSHGLGADPLMPKLDRHERYAMCLSLFFVKKIKKRCVAMRGELWPPN